MTQPATEDLIVLVDEHGNQTGFAGKMEVHEKGLLHRAFSVFIFNDHGEMLLQRRALNKYHFAGLWSNSCCSHPKPGEQSIDGAERRLYEELGLNAKLDPLFIFIYKAFDPVSGLTEFERDEVFTGKINSLNIPFNRNEVMDVRWVSKTDLNTWLKDKPDDFTYWFRECLQRVMLQCQSLFY